MPLHKHHTTDNGDGKYNLISWVLRCITQPKVGRFGEGRPWVTARTIINPERVEA